MKLEHLLDPKSLEALKQAFPTVAQPKPEKKVKTGRAAPFKKPPTVTIKKHKTLEYEND